MEQGLNGDMGQIGSLSIMPLLIMVILHENAPGNSHLTL